MKLIIILLINIIYICNACNKISINFQKNNNPQIFEITPHISISKRPIYKRKNLYLYHHVVSNSNGHARWFIGHDLESNAGIAYIDSWSVTPQNIYHSSPNSSWYSVSKSGWHIDKTIKAKCVGNDTSIYICSEIKHELCGYYYPVTSETSRNTFYRSIDALNLYQIDGVGAQGKRWLISHDPPGSNSGVLFIDCAVHTPNLIYNKCTFAKWKTYINNKWSDDDTVIQLNSNQYISALKKLRSELFHFKNSGILNNGVHIPTIGLGTGGFYPQQNRDIIPLTIKYGYQLIDSASEYKNEKIIGEILENNESPMLRRDLFITSKVWPTELGFQETLDSFKNTLQQLKTGYIDLYLIHWPECYRNWSWMHCNTKQGNGNWQQSWRALEKLYAEGKVRSIGISNFNLKQLNHLINFAIVPPQVLQNFMDPLNINNDILKFCSKHNIFFQAYSSLRSIVNQNIDSKGGTFWSLAKRIGDDVNKTPGEVILKWVLQYGRENGVQMGIIPRSSNKQRLQTNLLVDSDDWRLYRHHMNLFQVLRTKLNRQGHDEL